MKIVLLTLALIGAILIALEIGLRLVAGFGRPLLYQADPEIGYLLVPNQTTRRFGNRIAINQYSMRSPVIQPDRPDQTLRILLLGDSIANGGWWTDQPNTLSALLQSKLAENPDGFAAVEVLNASANSWAPRNELAYLKRFGSFEAQVIVLLINTDDLFGTAPTAIQVGRDRNYPDRLPALALTEVVTRYFIQPQVIPELKQIQNEGGDRVGKNLEAIGQIQQIAVQSDAKFLLVLTPLLREIGEPGSRDYEKVARQRLREFVQAHAIPFVDVLPLFNQISQPETLYHDQIHLSPIGNQEVMRQIAAKI